LFRNEGDGCLTSKYLEHRTDSPYTECCKRKQGSEITADPFEGTYDSCWLEIGNNRTSNLLIKRRGDVYDLLWIDISNSGCNIMELQCYLKINLLAVIGKFELSGACFRSTIFCPSGACRIRL
jgi:hypothetical protein